MEGLTPEQMTILSNIKSLIAQLDQMNTGAAIVDADVPADGVMEEEDRTYEGEEEMDKPMVPCNEEEEKEEFVAKSAGGPDEVANNDADKRIEEEGDVTSVLKALNQIVNRFGVKKSVHNKQVEKSAPRKTAGEIRIAKQINDLTTVVKSLAGVIRGQQVMVDSLYDGLGVSDTVRKGIESGNASNSVRKSNPSMTRNNIYQQQLLETVQKSNALLEESMQKKTAVVGSGSVRKSLAENMQSLLRG